MGNIWDNILASSLVLLVMLTVGILLLQIKNYQALKKRKQYFEKLHTDLKPGVKVSFSNGLYGTVRALHDDTADIEIKSGAVVTVSRYAISSIEQ